MFAASVKRVQEESRMQMERAKMEEQKRIDFLKREEVLRQEAMIRAEEERKRKEMERKEEMRKQQEMMQAQQEEKERLRMEKMRREEERQVSVKKTEIISRQEESNNMEEMKRLHEQKILERQRLEMMISQESKVTSGQVSKRADDVHGLGWGNVTTGFVNRKKLGFLQRATDSMERDWSAEASPAPSGGRRVTWADSSSGSRPDSRLQDVDTMRVQTPPLAGEWAAAGSSLPGSRRSTHRPSRPPSKRLQANRSPLCNRCPPPLPPPAIKPPLVNLLHPLSSHPVLKPQRLLRLSLE